MTIGTYAFYGCAALKTVEFSMEEGEEAESTNIAIAAFLGSNITQITLGSNWSVDLGSGPPSGFNTYYDNGKAAGVYTYSNNTWSFAASASEEESNENVNNEE